MAFIGSGHVCLGRPRLSLFVYYDYTVDWNGVWGVREGESEGGSGSVRERSGVVAYYMGW